MQRCWTLDPGKGYASTPIRLITLSQTSKPNVGEPYGTALQIRRKVCQMRSISRLLVGAGVVAIVVGVALFLWPLRGNGLSGNAVRPHYTAFGGPLTNRCRRSPRLMTSAAWGSRFRRTW